MAPSDSSEISNNENNNKYNDNDNSNNKSYNNTNKNPAAMHRKPTLDNKGCHGDTATRRYGDAATRRHGDTAIRRHGDTAMRLLPMRRMRIWHLLAPRRQSGKRRKHGDVPRRFLLQANLPRLLIFPIWLNCRRPLSTKRKYL